MFPKAQLVIFCFTFVFVCRNTKNRSKLAILQTFSVFVSENGSIFKSLNSVEFYMAGGQAYKSS